MPWPLVHLARRGVHRDDDRRQHRDPERLDPLRQGLRRRCRRSLHDDHHQHDDQRNPAMSADGAAPPPTTPPPPPQFGNRIPIAIEEEMKSAFMDYAMSVIVSRALPDARDGLKPVHRRILFTQHQMSNFWNRGVHQVRARRRRGAGQASPPRRHGRLRRPGAAGPGLRDALPADRRPGELRLRRRRSAGRLPVHRVPDGEDRRRAAVRHRQGDRRLPAELRRQGDRADGPAGPLPQPAGQRRRRHRGRHGDQHPAPQPARGDRRDDRPHQEARTSPPTS